MTKGISLSLNVIIVLALAVLALATLSAFFLSSSFGGISEAEAQRLFSSGCARYCEPDLYETFRNAYTAAQNDPGFMAGCTKLGYGDQQFPNRCLERCSNCNLDVREEDLNRGLDNLNALTTRVE